MIHVTTILLILALISWATALFAGIFESTAASTTKVALTLAYVFLALAALSLSLSIGGAAL